MIKVTCAKCYTPLVIQETYVSDDDTVVQVVTCPVCLDDQHRKDLREYEARIAYAKHPMTELDYYHNMGH